MTPGDFLSMVDRGQATIAWRMGYGQIGIEKDNLVKEKRERITRSTKEQLRYMIYRWYMDANRWCVVR